MFTITRHVKENITIRYFDLVNTPGVVPNTEDAEISVNPEAALIDINRKTRVYF